MKKKLLMLFVIASMFAAKNGFCAFFYANGNDYDVTVTVYYWHWTHAEHHYMSDGGPVVYTDDYGPEMGAFDITVYANDNAYISDIVGNQFDVEEIQNETIVWTEDVIFS